jgi:hypothetical protein
MAVQVSQHISKISRGLRVTILSIDELRPETIELAEDSGNFSKNETSFRVVTTTFG